MPLRNRVDPTGALLAVPARGALTGNRGCLVGARGDVVRERVRGYERWISCALSWRGRRLPVADPGRVTLLFFPDEPTALAAGHRPCLLCRRPDGSALLRALGLARATELDARLADERAVPVAERPVVDAADLPAGAFLLRDSGSWLVRGGELHRWTPDGYDAVAPLSGEGRLLTPPTLVRALSAGWRPAG